MISPARLTWFRRVFLWGCLAPTVTIAVLALVLWSPWYRHAVKRRWVESLTASLGLEVALEQVWRDGRGITHLRRLTLRDPDSQQTVMAIDEVRWADHDGKLLVSLIRPELDCDQLATCWATVHHRLLRGPRGRGGQILVSAREFTLRAGQQTVTVGNVQGATRTSADARTALVEFRLPWAPEGDVARISAIRRQGQRTPELAFDSGRTPLPCWLVGSHWPAVETLGPRAEFAGKLKWSDESGASDLQLMGRFYNAELAGWVDGQPAGSFQGEGQLLVQRARWQRGRLVEAAGHVVSRAGLIRPQLLDALARSWQLRRPPLYGDMQQPIAWNRLEFGFYFDAAGLQLRGQCGEAPPGTLLASGTRALLLSDGRTLSLPTVSRALNGLTATDELAANILPFPRQAADPIRTADR